MTARARRGPAPAGRPSVSSDCDDALTAGHRTAHRQEPRGTVVRLTGDAEELATDLLDRLGPAACSALAVWLVELVAEGGR